MGILRLQLPPEKVAGVGLGGLTTEPEDMCMTFLVCSFTAACTIWFVRIHHSSWWVGHLLLGTDSKTIESIQIVGVES